MAKASKLYVAKADVTLKHGTDVLGAHPYHRGDVIEYDQLAPHVQEQLDDEDAYLLNLVEEIDEKKADEYRAAKAEASGDSPLASGQTPGLPVRAGVDPEDDPGLKAAAEAQAAAAATAKAAAEAKTRAEETAKKDGVAAAPEVAGGPTAAEQREATKAEAKSDDSKGGAKADENKGK